MQNILGNSGFTKVVAYRELLGASEVYNMEFTHASGAEKTYVLWTRKANSKTDEGTKTPYKLKVGYQPEYAFSVFPADKDMDGDTVRYQNPTGSIDLNLSETPQFVVISANSTSIDFQQTKEFKLDVYPNPSSSEVHISLLLSEKQKVNVSAYSMEGKLLETIEDGIIESGTHQYTFGNGLKAGTYLLAVKYATGLSYKKVMLLNE